MHIVYIRFLALITHARLFSCLSLVFPASPIKIILVCHPVSSWMSLVTRVYLLNGMPQLQILYRVTVTFHLDLLCRAALTY